MLALMLALCVVVCSRVYHLRLDGVASFACSSRHPYSVRELHTHNTTRHGGEG